MTVPGHNWTIQIGAYADQAFAKAQLDAYAAEIHGCAGPGGAAGGAVPGQ